MSKEGSKYRKRGRSSAPNIDEQLQTIISRLTALEDTSRRPLSEANACVGSPTRSHTPPPPPPLLDLSNESTTLVAARGDARGEERVGACADAPVPSVASGMASVAASLPSSAPASSAETIMSEVADKLVTAINAINPQWCDACHTIRGSRHREIAMEAASLNRESLRELARQRASELLDENRVRQDARVNERHRAPRSFQLNDLVIVRKTSQSTGQVWLRLFIGSYGKTTQAVAAWFCGEKNGPPTCVTMRRHMTVPLTPKAGQREVSKKSKRRSMLSHQDHATRPPSQRHQTLMMLRSRTTRCQERPC
ncbi:uncharacterized protein LOC114363927 isoform X3 [Ostrinia furnacalis]|uniref:uncharacterized protein LOC114363927 isoform X3 n=1 Tax=Ostrinia furnacalis TaxID=93504 RepID=UPI00103C21F4|nr:uncharacterized protein LOC114363927 isoform X3 [Ostrinia furnacalis]